MTEWGGFITTLFLVKSVILGKILPFPVAQFPQLKNELDKMTSKVLVTPPLIDWQHKFSKYENMSHRLQTGLSQKSRCMLALCILYLKTGGT